MLAGSPWSRRRAASDQVDGATGAVVPRWPPFPLRRLALRYKLVRRAEAEVGVAPLHEVGGHLSVAIEPVGLAVRPVQAADADTLVPIETEPAETFESVLLELGGLRVRSVSSCRTMNTPPW